MEFGEYLREKREAKGMTIRQLALYAGCSDSYLSMLERGERGRGGPTRNILRKLAKPLGIPYEVLLHEIGYEPDQEECNGDSISMIEILREAYGDTKKQFATRIGLSETELEAMMQQNVSIETVQQVCEMLFSHHKALTTEQKELLQRVEEMFYKRPSEVTRLVERVLKAVVE
ncbi:hypothetical protein CBW65_03895 [Tumebacillus avium]|uniref:HTH cro/C1-type domain-containing protein n=1 Tax=Tumebacillus avium TaxID=1903704 RepID=A0A1Y0IJ09_9BACL|nr:helix-turn-helix transcriptional regulator [Tumebacillus avium]ARU60300.1 hypothetical protein CBW65_03895 [Tumebacillus avium]